jgi:hypothetical protein
MANQFDVLEDAIARLRAKLRHHELQIKVHQDAIKEHEKQKELICSEFAEVESALKVLRRYEEKQQETQGKPISAKPKGIAPSPRKVATQRNDLEGSTVDEAAERVLAESGEEWLYFTEVARRAIQRGYRGRVAGDDVEQNAKAFLDYMRRHPEKFARREIRNFRPAEYGGGEPPRRHGVFGPSDGLTREKLCVEVLRDADRPMSPKEIAEVLIERKQVQPTSLKSLRGSIINAMSRSEKFVRKDRGEWGLAEWSD